MGTGAWGTGAWGTSTLGAWGGRVGDGRVGDSHLWARGGRARGGAWGTGAWGTATFIPRLPSQLADSKILTRHLRPSSTTLNFAKLNIPNDLGVQGPHKIAKSECPPIKARKRSRSDCATIGSPRPRGSPGAELHHRPEPPTSALETGRGRGVGPGRGGQSPGGAWGTVTLGGVGGRGWAWGTVTLRRQLAPIFGSFDQILRVFWAWGTVTLRRQLAPIFGSFDQILRVFSAKPRDIRRFFTSGLPSRSLQQARPGEFRAQYCQR